MHAFLFGILGFLWSYASNLGFVFSDASFVLRVGASSLPLVYQCVAGGLILISVFLLYSVHHFSPAQIFTTMVACGIGVYSGAAACLLAGIEATWIWYAIRIFSYLYFAVLLTGYWTYIDQYHCIQAAKRHFSLYSSMIFLGFASAGATLRLGVFEVRHALLIIVATFIAIIGVIQIIKARLSSLPEIEEEPEANESFSLVALIQAILKSRFTLLMLANNFIIFVLWVITEYNFMVDFQNHFGEVTHSVTGQFGQFMGGLASVVGICNLFFGLFVYSRLINRFGMGILLIISPLLFLATFIGWQVTNALIVPMLGYFIVEGTLDVIDDNTFCILLKAVPSKMKYKIRVLIESCVEPIGMLTSGWLLSIPFIDSRVLGLFLSVFAVGIAITLRILYFKRVQFKVAENKIHVDHWWQKIWNRGKCIESQILDLLNHDELHQKRLESEGIVSFENETALEKVLTQSEELSTNGKIHFIDLIAKSCCAGHQQVIERLESWITKYNEQELNSVIYVYLAREGALHPNAK